MMYIVHRFSSSDAAPPGFRSLRPRARGGVPPL